MTKELIPSLFYIILLIWIFFFFIIYCYKSAKGSGKVDRYVTLCYTCRKTHECLEVFYFLFDLNVIFVYRYPKVKKDR